VLSSLYIRVLDKAHRFKFSERVGHFFCPTLEGKELQHLSWKFLFSAYLLNLAVLVQERLKIFLVLSNFEQKKVMRANEQ
jgi:hypothetical protein